MMIIIIIIIKVECIVLLSLLDRVRVPQN